MIYRKSYPGLRKQSVSDFKRRVNDGCDVKELKNKKRGRKQLLPEEFMEKTIEIIKGLRLKGAPVSSKGYHKQCSKGYHKQCSKGYHKQCSKGYHKQCSKGYHKSVAKGVAKGIINDRSLIFACREWWVFEFESPVGKECFISFRERRKKDESENGNDS